MNLGGLSGEPSADYQTNRKNKGVQREIDDTNEEEKNEPFLASEESNRKKEDDEMTFLGKLLRWGARVRVMLEVFGFKLYTVLVYVQRINVSTNKPIMLCLICKCKLPYKGNWFSLSVHGEWRSCHVLFM